VKVDIDQTGAGDPGGGTGPKQILFVDDEPNFLAGLRRMLRVHRDRWELHFAENVDQALALCKTVAFDTVVSDVNMPGKSGFDLLAALKAWDRTRDIPVIILTGNAENDLKRRALDLGATDLLNKPVGMEDLTARLRNATRLKSYQDLLRDQNVLLERKVRERTADLEQSRLDIIWRLAKAGEFRDEETGAHVLRVAACCRALAEALGLDSGYTAALFATSPLHDIGKIGIPDGILLKSGRLTADERRIMQRHCEIGAAILTEKPKGVECFGAAGADAERALDCGDGDELDLRAMAAEIAMTHHERWDGTGYPKGLSGEAIPASGRIVAIADVYDALRSERAYKPAFGIEETLETMRAGRGTHFAPHTFDAFEGIAEAFEKIRDCLRDNDTVVEDDETSSFR